MTATNAAQVDPAIYAKSGDISKHLEGVKKQYDTQNKIEFYKQVMGDGTANIHFGKWDNVDLDQEGAYGKASEQMTDYMFELVSGLCECEEGDFKYVDLGSGWVYIYIFACCLIDFIWVLRKSVDYNT